MDNMVKIFKANNGYVRMSELKSAHIHTRNIAKAVNDGLIEKIKPGLYKLIDYPWDEHESFADVCHSNKKAVICLLSAASYYELTTFQPPEIYVAVPNNMNRFILNYPPIQFYYFVKCYYEPGIDILETVCGKIKIYNKEKTIGDLFRYINKIGEDMAIESLKTYLRDRKNRNIPKLIQYADICGVRKKIEPIVKAILHT